MPSSTFHVVRASVALSLAASLLGCGSSDGSDPCEGANCADVGADVADTTDVADVSDVAEVSPDAPDAVDAVDALPDIGPDQDGDRLPDSEEGEGDFDEDGIPNIADTDSDNDGIEDGVEGSGDQDGDGFPNFLDTDADDDGFLDSEEGTDDPDEDGLPNFLDTDSDEDGMSDTFEGDIDFDEDGILDRYDYDSDNDTVPDRHENRVDFDEDGIPGYHDLDSDNDGWSDAEEYGFPPGSRDRPRDTDRDGAFDINDLDSDADGLPDADELGCPDSSERALADSDGDGINDLIEVAFSPDADDEGQACDADRAIDDDVDFFFELPYEADPQTDVLDFTPDVRRADVAFNVDTTGSMGGVRNTLRDTLSTSLIPTLSVEIDDSAYAFSQFDDFPCNGHGSSSDRPFILQQRVTTDVAAAAAGVGRLELHSGGDGKESGFEAIYQVSTGFGREVDCLSSTSEPEVYPFDPAEGFVEGVADGTIGGVGFRDGALPIIVHFTDNAAHAKGDSDNYRYGASANETFAAMRSIGARLIAVASGSTARNDLEAMTLSTGSTVPACAWDDLDTGERPSSCGPEQCCTGSGGSGRAPVDGVCPLVYDINSGGGGLVESIVQGVEVLTTFSTFDLRARVRGDEEETAFDTSRFITSVLPVAGVGPSSGCATDPILVDSDDDGVNDLFREVVPGSNLVFDITAFNDVVESTRVPQVFVAYIDIVQRGGAILDTQVVTILVPPEIKPR